ncbi:hypothetical protein GP486_006419, partial [Trichoglossum hirsutum]
MRDFVKLVRVEVSHTETGQGVTCAHPKIRFLDTNTLGIQSFTQQSRFQYLLVDSDYVFEVTKYEHLSHESSSKAEGSTAATSGVPDVSWGASFYNSQWDTILRGQVDVGVGRTG